MNMGGNHTLHIAFPRLDKFACVGVYSAGLIGAFPGLVDGARGVAPAAAPPTAPVPPPTTAPASPPVRAMTATEWETAHAKMLGDPALKQGLKVLWLATGKEDRLITTTAATVDLLEKHGFNPVVIETPGGHTWINWRAYLGEFVPQLFQ